MKKAIILIFALITIVAIPLCLVSCNSNSVFYSKEYWIGCYSASIEVEFYDNSSSNTNSNTLEFYLSLMPDGQFVLLEKRYSGNDKVLISKEVGEWDIEESTFLFIKHSVMIICDESPKSDQYIRFSIGKDGSLYWVVDLDYQETLGIKTMEEEILIYPN